MTVHQVVPFGAPAPAPRSRSARILTPALVIGGLTAATVALRLRDPHAQGSWGLCPSAQAGFWCPGCRGLRAVNDLTHGQLGAAASSNLFLVVMMPVAIFFLARWGLDAWRGVRRAPSTYTTPALFGLAAVALVFTVLRNLPMGAWLAP